MSIFGTLGKKKIEIKSINKVPYFCVPVNESLDGSGPVPAFDASTDYLSENSRLSFINEELAERIEAASNEIKEIKEKITNFDKNKPEGSTKKYIITRKRDRRKSREISRLFNCELCGKSYG